MAATQESTQPITDPRRVGLSNSGLHEEDVADIICILHPNSPAAHQAVAATAKFAPCHILQQEELEYERFAPAPLDLALRLSSQVKDPAAGFCFGRNRDKCDVLLTPDDTAKKISGFHFRIYLTRDGVLMLQDTSTNGTIVENVRLRKARKDCNSSRVLNGGSVIQVVGDIQEEIRFVVRIPSREGCAAAYTENLLRYFERIQLQEPATDRHKFALPARPNPMSWSGANNYGMHWNGGTEYNPVGMIGKGAFATVYKIARVNDGHVYACKELEKRRHMKNGILDRKVHNEMSIMRDLKHPNIVEFVDYHEEEKHLYIVMEYVSCGELSTYLQSQKRIPEDLVRTITRQLLHALQYLHRRNITHRDVKPDNILISSVDPLRVKLSDFGLSKITQDETFLKTFCGTLLYCAPEVYPEYETYQRGAFRKRRRLGDPPAKTSPYDQSVDMWSLGAVLYHLLSGIPPYVGSGENKGAQMLRNIMTSDADFDLLRSMDISDEGVDFVSRLLNRNPDRRAKIRECLQHSWIATVPDVDVYEDDDYVSESPAEGLAAIGEDDEEELDASQLSLNDGPEVYDDEDLTQPKRPRIGKMPVDVRYPSLPEVGSFVGVPLPAASNPKRLFGEVTQSALRSSGVLGADLDAFDGSFSVHDYVSTAGESISEGRSMKFVSAGSAPSLMGAENLVGQLNMNSSHPVASNIPPSQTVRTPARQTSPAGVSQSSATEATPRVSRPPLEHETTPRAADFSRRIELPHPDTASESSSTSGDDADDPDHVVHEDDFDVELAVTIDAQTGRELSDLRFRDKENNSATRPGESLPQNELPPSPALSAAGDQFTKPRPLLGKLVTVPGSVIDLTIRLEDRLTSWGRGLATSVRYNQPMDDRVPLYALELTFWAPGIESRIKSGVEWTSVPGVMTILSTKARRCIWVNEVELKREHEKGHPNFGKLYTGDIITVWKDRERFIKFRCEFYHGESAQTRPEGEKGFRVKCGSCNMRSRA